MKKIMMFNILSQILLASACCAIEPQSAFEQLGEVGSKMAIDMPCLCLPAACPQGCGQIITPAVTPSNPVQLPSFYDAWMTRVYLAQPKLKQILSAHFTKAGDDLKARLMAEESVRIFSDKKAVYIVQNKNVAKLEDPELVASAYAAAKTAAAAGQLPGNKLLIEGAIVGAIGCMTSDECWGAVGDGVSAVSEWLNS